MWQLYSILAGFFLAFADALTKRAIVGENEYYIVWIRLFYSAIPLVVLSFMVDIPSSIDIRFWFIVLLLAPVEITAIILYVKAIKLSPISLCVPFLAFTPVFLLLISLLTSGNLPELSGLIGVVLIVGGSYILSSKASDKSLLAPFVALWQNREPGVRLMLIVSFLFSITSTLAKVAITMVNPFFFAVFYYIMLVPLYLPVLLVNYKGPIFSKVKMSHVCIGVALALMVCLHTIAISITRVVYMVSLKRTSLLFSILFGYLFFHEKSINRRLLGGVLMFAGISLLTLL